MQNYWNMTEEELKQAFPTGMDGLTDEQVKEIRSIRGENCLTEGKKERIIVVFFRQFCDLLIIILLIAAGISMFSGNVESTIVIAAVLIMNAILGTVQHVKAQKSLDSLKQLSSPTAKVVRNGVVVEVPSREIVPGDLIRLEAGDMIVADGRILHNYSLQVNDSALTG